LADCAQTACTVGCDEGELRRRRRQSQRLRRERRLDRPHDHHRGRHAGLHHPDAERRRDGERLPEQLVPERPEEFRGLLQERRIRLRGRTRRFSTLARASAGSASTSARSPAALFTLKGNGNALEDFTYRYFPKACTCAPAMATPSPG